MSKTYITLSIVLSLICGTILVVYPNQHSVNAQVSTAMPTLFPNQGGTFIRIPLTCPEHLSVRKGLSWRGIELGVSSLDDIQEIYGVIASRTAPLETGSFAPVYDIALTPRASRERKIPEAMEVCIVNGKVAVLSLSGDNDELASPSLLYWVQKYGPPNIVTWSFKDWKYRDLVWSNLGLALEVRIDTPDPANKPDQTYVESVIFFPPAQNQNDLLSWPYLGLREIAPTSPNDSGFFDKNPFHFESILVAATSAP